MNPEQLRDKCKDIQTDETKERGENAYTLGFEYNDVESATEGLIQYHEDYIEELIKEMKWAFEKSKGECKLSEDNTKILVGIQPVIKKILKEIEDINIIEVWYEDAI